MSDEVRWKRLMNELGWETPPARMVEALTHPSYANERGRKGLCPDNQRLEFLGDAVLSLCVSEFLMRTYPNRNEGDLSRMRATLVCADSLAAFAHKIKLGEAIRLGRGAHVEGEQKLTNILADAVEALLGSAYLDGGLLRAHKLAEQIVQTGMTRVEDLAERDAKSALQEQVQRQGQPPPAYVVVAEAGPDHNRWFEVAVTVEGQEIGRGSGKSKKLAAQAAARVALHDLHGSEPRGGSLHTTHSAPGESLWLVVNGAAAPGDEGGGLPGVVEGAMAEPWVASATSSGGRRFCISQAGGNPARHAAIKISVPCLGSRLTPRPSRYPPAATMHDWISPLVHRRSANCTPFAMLSCPSAPSTSARASMAQP